jgi:hypothetical protein
VGEMREANMRLTDLWFTHPHNLHSHPGRYEIKQFDATVVGTVRNEYPVFVLLYGKSSVRGVFFR